MVPMVYVGCLSIGSGIAAWLPGLGWMLFLVIWFLFFRYAMTMLVLTARGKFDADEAAISLERDDFRPVKQVFYILITFGVGLLAAANMGPAFTVFYVLAVSISLPAAIMVIAIEDSLLEALNPLRLFSVMSSIGMPYLLLSLFLLLLQGGNTVVYRVFGRVIPNFIEFPVMSFVTMYFLLVMYNMMGYVVYQYHEALGYGVDKTFDEHIDEKSADPAASALDRRIARMVADGDVQGAVNEQLADMAYERNDITKNQKLHKLFLTLGETDKTLPHALHLISLLVAAGRNEVAYEVLVKVKTISAGFALTDADAVLALAEIAKRCNNTALALEMLGAFARQHPQHPDVPGVYLLAAKVHAEHKRDDAQAIRILKALITGFPGAAPAIEAQAYLAVLERTTAPPAAGS